MTRLLAAIAVLLGLSLPLRADGDASALFDALGRPQVIEIMAEEGIDYGSYIEEELFPGRGGPSWDATVAALYDTSIMRATVAERFIEALGGTDVGPLLAFFTDGPGTRFVELEISARRAFLDQDIEAAAEEAAAELGARDPARYALLSEFIEVNDLVGSNVMGAMNANYAFYMGLMAGDAFERQLTEDEILADVWSQEADIRAETESWVYGYLGLAYEPMTDEDLQAYVALSRTPGGRAMNGALFAAFDVMYTGISRRLGEAAALFLAGEDI